MARILSLVMLICTTLLAGGCSSISITPDKLDAIKSVSVDEDVKVADKFSYLGPEQSLGTALGGMVGGLAVLATLKIPEKIKQYLDTQSINISHITRSEFLKGLQKDPRFSSKITQNGEAHFVLEVQIYGLIEKNPFSSEYKPWLCIRAKLVDASGKVLWQDRDYVAQHNDMVPAASYKTYFEDPSTFRTGFTDAADAVTQMLLQNIGHS